MAKKQGLWITQRIHKFVNSVNNVNKIVDNHASQDSKAKLRWSVVALLLSLQCLNRFCGMASNSVQGRKLPIQEHLGRSLRESGGGWRKPSPGRELCAF